jgi:hypothetical protein
VTRVSDVARVRILLADYAGVDPSGKLNIIGGGISAVIRIPGQGQAPVSLAVSLAVPPDLYDTECDVQLTLEDQLGRPITLPAAGTEAPQKFQIRQRPRFAEPMADTSWAIPRSYMWAVAHLIGIFPTGLPIKDDGTYQWRVIIDGQTRDDWTERFVVASQPTLVPRSTLPPDAPGS